MRLSVHKDDPGYYKRGYLYQAFLNGKEVSKCFTADEDQGLLFRHKTDNNGCVIANGDELETEILYGKVELKLIKRSRKL